MSPCIWPGDQQEADRVACQARTSHGCHIATRVARSLLGTKRFARQRNTWVLKNSVVAAAAGAHSRGKPVGDLAGFSH
jgi:hypothetical protein